MKVSRGSRYFLKLISKRVSQIKSIKTVNRYYWVKTSAAHFLPSFFFCLYHTFFQWILTQTQSVNVLNGLVCVLGWKRWIKHLIQVFCLNVLFFSIWWTHIFWFICFLRIVLKFFWKTIFAQSLQFFLLNIMEVTACQVRMVNWRVVCYTVVFFQNVLLVFLEFSQRYSELCCLYSIKNFRF